MGASAGLFQSAAYASQGINDIAGAYSSSNAIRSKAAFESQAHQQNAKFAELNAEDAARRGEKAAQEVNRKARDTISSQRVAAAAQGLDPNSGLALDAQSETVLDSGLDMSAIRNNAWRESLGYKSEAISSRGKGRFAELAGENEAGSTLITGGLNFFSKGLSAYGEAREAMAYRGKSAPRK